MSKKKKDKFNRRKWAESIWGDRIKPSEKDKHKVPDKIKSEIKGKWNEKKE